MSWRRGPRLVATPEVRRIVSAALAHGGRGSLAVAVIFVDDEYLCALHERFLGDPSATDVITFDLGASDAEDGVACEIYVSVDCARRVAHRRGEPVERELALYLVHGALHLCGFDDHERGDRRRMRAAEAHVLRALGYRARVTRKRANVRRNTPPSRA
ncbi:MAG: rRNA maturation RNase YbeY [Planctomycetota bacterium]